MAAKPRIWINRSLWAGALLLVALAVSGALWGLLAAMGDTAGARVAKGISLGLAICWGLDLVTLVVLLAVAQLKPPETEDVAGPDRLSDSDQPPAARPPDPPSSSGTLRQAR